MSNVQFLKDKILNLAVKGKLVENIDFDVTKLIDLLGLSQNDVSFEPTYDFKGKCISVPLKKVASIRTGASFPKETVSLKKQNSFYRILRGGNILPFYWFTKSDDIFVPQEYVKDDMCLRKNDLITPAVTSLENVGKFARIGEDLKEVSVGGFVYCIRPLINNDIFSKYLLYYLSSPLFVKDIKNITKKSGSAFYNINKELLSNLVIALPSLEEQSLIVDKLDRLFEIANAIENSQTNISALESKLTNKVIDLALKGKITVQDNSENAKEYLKILNKKECENNFDLPKNWICLNLEDCGRFTSGYTPKPFQLTNDGKVPYFKVSDMNTKGNEKYLTLSGLFLIDESMRTFKPNTIVYPKNGGAVFTNKKRILSQRSVVDLNTGGFEVNDLFDVEYFFIFFQTIDFKYYSKGSALPTLDMDKIKKIAIPIPPVNEQKRIVAKIDEIMSVCKQLVK